MGHDLVDAEGHVGGAADPGLSRHAWVCGLSSVAVRRRGVPADLVGVGQVNLQPKPRVARQPVAAEPVVAHGVGVVASAVHTEVQLDRQGSARSFGFDAKGVVHDGCVDPRLDVTGELRV